MVQIEHSNHPPPACTHIHKTEFAHLVSADFDREGGQKFVRGGDNQQDRSKGEARPRCCAMSCHVAPWCAMVCHVVSWSLLLMCFEKPGNCGLESKHSEDLKGFGWFCLALRGEGGWGRDLSCHHGSGWKLVNNI